MEPFRLKMKIGTHEFEAEGEQETVERQFALWRELIASPSAASPPQAASPPPPPSEQPRVPSPPVVSIAGNMREEYDKLFHHEGRIVSMTILPTSKQREADSALLLLLGQKVYNGTDLVTGAQIMDGLKQSGLGEQRADRVFGDYMGQDVTRIGQHRAVRYRLTNMGAERARQLAVELLKMVV